MSFVMCFNDMFDIGQSGSLWVQLPVICVQQSKNLPSSLSALWLCKVETPQPQTRTRNEIK